MRNLLERMKPEVREMFEKAKKEYPTTIEEIEKELTQNHWIREVKFGRLLDLTQMLFPITDDRFNNTSPEVMFSIFEDEND